MSRYIDADELRKEVEDSMERNPHESGESGNLRSNHRVEHKHFMRLICSQPTADVEPVRHAHWISDPDYPSHTICSNCKNWINMYQLLNYCPNCGAKMDERVSK